MLSDSVPVNVNRPAGADLEQAAYVNGIVQVPRRQPALLSLDRQLAVRDAGWRRRDRVRPTHLLAVDLKRQVQVLAREKVERQARAGRRDEAERSDLGCLVEDSHDLQLSGPRFRHRRYSSRRSGPILMGVGAELEVVGDQSVKEKNAEGGGECDRPRGVGFDEHVEVQSAGRRRDVGQPVQGLPSRRPESPDHAVRRGHRQRDHDDQADHAHHQIGPLHDLRGGVADVRCPVEAEEEEEVKYGVEEGVQPEHPPELAEPSVTGDPARGRDG